MRKCYCSCCAVPVHQLERLHWTLPAADSGDVLQVIHALFSAVPPALWFSPERPLVFGLMTCLVLGLSVVAATLLKGLLSTVMGAVRSSTAKVPESPKLTTAGPPRELIEMHARAVEVHSPMSPASALSA